MPRSTIGAIAPSPWAAAANLAKVPAVAAAADEPRHVVGRIGREAGVTKRSAPSRPELEQQVAELVAQQAAISEVLRAIAGSPHDLQPIFETVLANATRLCRATAGALFLYEDQLIRLAARTGPPNPYLVARDGAAFAVPPGSPHARLAETRSPVHIADMAADPAYLAGNPIVVALVEVVGARSYLLVPMLRDEKLIGGLAILRDVVAPFTDRQIDLIAAFATQAAIALESTRRERQIRELHAELTHANRVAAIGQLSSSIAHEVNQPLAAVLLNSDVALRWLSRATPDLARARQAIGGVTRDARRASDIIGRIRDLIRKAPPRTDLFDINDAIRDVIALIRGEASKFGVSVQTQFADGLPLVAADRVQLQQVMLNLLINAIQAMSGVADATRDLEVSTADAAPEGMRVAVRDSGPGLGPDVLERLFEPFYTTKPDGLGMGLSICRSIIEAHGGRLWAIPNEPRGAVFQFTLPAPREASTSRGHDYRM
jgi:signal transduction histidine kinase